MSSIESRIEKLEAAKPTNPTGEAALVMRQIERRCAGLPDDQAEAKIAEILKLQPDEVLHEITNQSIEDSQP